MSGTARPLAALLVGILYLIVARDVADLTESDAATYWPGAGLFIAALVLAPRRWWPHLLAGMAALEACQSLLSGVDPGVALAWAGANVLQALVGASLLHRCRAASLRTLPDVGWFVVACVVTAPIVGSLLGALGYTLLDGGPGYVEAALQWILGDGVGILTTAPALIVLGGSERARRSLRTPEAAAAFAAVLVMCALAFEFGSWTFIWPYLTIPAALWAAVRLAMPGATLSTLLLAHAANAATALDVGTFAAALPEHRAAIAAQGFAGGLTIAMLVVGARTDETLADVRTLTADQLAAEQKARQSALLQRIAGQMAKVAGWAMDVPEGNVIRSDGMAAIIGEPGAGSVPLEEGLSRYAEADRERVATAVERCIADGTPFDLEADFHAYSGQLITLRLVGEPEYDDTGTCRRIVGALQDVTEQRQEEVAHRAVAERLVTTLETISDGLATLDREMRFTYVNRMAEVILRRNRHDLLGRNVWEAFPEAVGNPAYHAYHRALQEGTTETLEEVYYPPLDVWFGIRVHPTADGIAVYFQDDTEAHLAREELRARARRLAEQAALLDKAADAIVVRDLRGVVTYWNRSAEGLYELRADEAIGQVLEDVLTPDPEQLRNLRRGLQLSGEWHGELTQRSASGNELVVESRWTVVRDDEDRATAVLIFNTDVSERKRLEDQLLRAQRLESIGTLAGGLAHDLNNALAPIVISAGLLESLEGDESRRAIIRTITGSATRASEMVRQMLDFARGVDGQRVPVDIEAVVDDVERIANDTFLKAIRTERSRGVRTLPVRGDATQLQQVLMNLAVNARDAMAEGGTLRLATDVVVLDEPTASTYGLGPGPYVRIRVEDDGEGIDPALLDRIFDPFFTTKPQGHGTGLGLSTSDAIVRSHGGSLTVSSTPGVGTTFSVHLPVDHEASSPPVEPLSVLPYGNGEVVLVVDDEDPVRATLVPTLDAFGYAAVEANCGRAAIDAVRSGARIDIVITDMMMPDMDGPDTIRGLHQLRPGLPVIAASGAHTEHLVRRARDLGVEHFLRKPFTVSELLEALRRALDAADADAGQP